MIRYGVVGCGAIHAMHCDAAKNIDGADLIGVYDVIPEKAAKTAERYGVRAFASLSELLSEVDAITVCVPSGLHAEVGIRAANAGKHVLVEKPIDVTLAKAMALVDACESNGVRLGTISQHRFSEQIRNLHDAAQNGSLGPLLQGDAYIKWYRTQAYYDSGDWRGTWELDGGGCLINQGVHYIDMIQWIMGGVKAVQAQVRTAAHQIEVEDIANALIEYKNGAIGVIQGSTSFYPGLAERLEVHGRYGSVIIEGDRTKLWKVDQVAANEGLYGGGVQMQPTPSLHMHDPEEAVQNASSDPTALWGEQHRLQVEDFTKAIVEDREPFMTGRMALEPLKIILAIYESSRQGGARIEIA
ncbi:MAG: Gfo/Idh/MocA family oxidoreductase [Fimbriimonas sp.]|nr:Gfo/Idh/MocA family oxidoreductase [Fimbriimonas sp.]